MKIKIGIFLVIVLTWLLISCATTGEYMPLRASEQAAILGAVQSTFSVNGGFRYKRTVNRQAYITLLTEAQNKYPDINVDIRDISWVVGTMDYANNYEYTAIGKVIKLPINK